MQNALQEYALSWCSLACVCTNMGRAVGISVLVVRNLWKTKHFPWLIVLPDMDVKAEKYWFHCGDVAVSARFPVRMLPRYTAIYRRTPLSTYTCQRCPAVDFNHDTSSRRQLRLHTHFEQSPPASTAWSANQVEPYYITLAET